MIGLLAVVAYALIATALYISDGFYHPVSLICVTAALVLTLVGVIVRFPESADNFGRKYTPWALATVLAAEVVFTFLTGFSFLNANNLLLGLAFVFFGMLPGLYLTKVESKFDWRLPLILLVFTGLFAVMIPRYNRNDLRRAPKTDVWYSQQYACHYLLQGKNPYAEEYPNIYGHAKLYGEGIIKNGKVQSFGYPPLSLLLSVPGYLVCDVRWSMLLALIGTIIFFVAIGRSSGGVPSHPSELAGLLIVYNPRVFYLLSESWTEPFVGLAISFCVWAMLSRFRFIKPIAFAAVIASKQYGVLLTPSFLASRRLSWLDVILGCGLATLTAVPFLIWNWDQFWFDNVIYQVRQPFRPDALSVLAFFDREVEIRLPALTGFVAAGLVMLITLAMRRRTLSESLLGGAAILLAFFVFNKQAFFNYYWLVSLVLLVTVVASFVPPLQSDVAKTQDNKTQ